MSNTKDDFSLFFGGMCFGVTIFILILHLTGQTPIATARFYQSEAIKRGYGSMEMVEVDGEYKTEFQWKDEAEQ